MNGSSLLCSAETSFVRTIVSFEGLTWLENLIELLDMWFHRHKVSFPVIHVHDGTLTPLWTPPRNVVDVDQQKYQKVCIHIQSPELGPGCERSASQGSRGTLVKSNR